MRVVIIGMYYSPEVTGNAPYTSDLAEFLADRGDEVTVVAGLPHYPLWRIAPGTSRALLRREAVRGVTVVRAAHYVPVGQSTIGRAVYEGTFGLTALLGTMTVAKPDAILGVVPNLSSGILARVTAERTGAPYGLLFQNLMGQAARQSGMDGARMAAKAIAAAESWATRRARAIGVVTSAFIPYLMSRGIPESLITLVPNWTRLVVPAIPVAETRARFGWASNEHIVLHAGNIGLMQGLEQVIEAARLAVGRGDPVRFVLAGGGSQSASIRAAAKDLPNVTFLGVLPDGVYASVLRAADILLLSERPTEVDMSLPSKLISYFAAGRPIVAAIPPQGASAREIGRSGAGLIVPAGEPALLLDAFARVRGDSALASQLAAAGLAFAEESTSATACLHHAAAFVEVIAGHSPTPLTTLSWRKA